MTRRPLSDQEINRRIETVARARTVQEAAEKIGLRKDTLRNFMCRQGIHRPPPPYEGPRDWCSPDGARRLKAMIENYWKARGRTVTVTLKEESYHPRMRSRRVDVRSDLVFRASRRTQTEAGE